jgi:peptidyl-prolyl cis-trans isomerase SurA
MKRTRTKIVPLLALLGLGAGLPSTPAPAQARVVEKVAAVVGDEIILQSEVEEQAQLHMADIAAITDKAQREARATALRREVLDRLIDEQLIVQQATEYKINVTSEEVDRAIEQVKQANRLTDAQLSEELRRFGMTIAMYRQNTKRELLKHKVLGMAVGARVSVSDADVQNYYEKHHKSGTNVEVRASHIFVQIPDGADAAKVREREAFAKQILTRARGGEDFAKIAKELSEDPATREKGGDIGYFGREIGLPRSVEELVFSLKVGEIGGPVRGDRGFHVIKLADRRAKEAKALDDMKDQIRAQLRQKEMERQTKIYLSDLRRRVLVDVRM